MNSPKRVNSFMTIYFIWEITGVQILVLLGGYLLQSLLPNMSVSDSVVNLMILQDMFLMLLPILLGLKIFGGSLEEMIPLKGLSPWNVIYIVMTGFLMLPVMSFISVITSIFSPSTSTEVEAAIMGAPFSMGMLIMAVLPAVFEETVFRGFVYGGLKRFGRKKAMVLSAFYFALFHLCGYQIPYAMFSGIILAIVVEYSGSILGPMLLHFTINGTQIAASYWYGANEAAIAVETAAEADIALTMSDYMLLGFTAAIFFVLLLLML
ncbi:MAG: CPBP family intramembrane metalloprotease, partial [Clostridiales bacterium]|nr:CPBP family intramembrane metalloprotease [Clostridiales bacterium]